VNRLAVNPSRFLAESDLDWGQDLQRLFGTADPTRHGLPTIKPLLVYQRTTGWVAVSLHVMTISAAAMQKARHTSTPPLSWLNEERPVTRVGKSIDLYYVK